MTTAALKKKIKALVDKETSGKKLAKVHDTLTKETKAEAIRRRMQEVAEASERDIKAGRTMTLEEFEHDTDAFIKELFAENGKVRTAASRKARASKANLGIRRKARQR